MPGPPGAWNSLTLPGEGMKVWVLGIDAAFDGVAADARCRLAERQPLAGGDLQLLLDDVDAGDHLGDRMLDLHARVHFDEVELVVLVEELEGAGAAVADLAAGARRSARRSVAQLSGIDAGRGRFLDDLLVAALHRAVAVAQVDHVAVGVGQHLESRCGAGARGTSPCRPGRRRRRHRPRPAGQRTALSSAASLCTTRMPRPPPPAAALMMTG
jgi:hypothetical protein